MPEGANSASVSVGVTPDARDFWVRFQEQTRSGATEAGRRAREDFDRGFNAGRGPTIRPDVDTTQARAQLAALNRDGSQNSTSLVKILATLAPALVPIAGAAATAAAGFGALGVAGVLAVRGIKAEMKAGSAVGLQYAGQVAVAKNALGELQKTAATNFLGGFQSSVGKLSTQLPAFNVEVAKSSTALGQITSHVTGGLVAGFTTFAPVIDAAEAAFVKLSAQFEHFATTADGAKFAQNLVADFQQVVPLVENLAGAIVKLIVAAAPVGGALVSVISDLAAALNSIPTPVLTALVTAFTALSAARIASNALGALSVSLRGVGAGAAGASSGIGLLGAGLARITPYVAAVVAVNIASKALANSTNDYATSAGNLTLGLHQVGTAFGDLTSGNFSGALSNAFGSGLDKAKEYRQYVQQTKTAINDLIPPSAKATTAFVRQWNLGTDAAKIYATQVENFQKHLSSTNQSFIDPGNVGKSVVAGHGSIAGAPAGPTTGQVLQQSYVKEYTKDLQALTVSQTNFNTAAARSSSISSLSGAYAQQATSIQKVAAEQQKLIGSGKDVVATYHGVKIGADSAAAAQAKFGGDTTKAAGYLFGLIDSYKKNSAAAKATAADAARLGQVVGTTAAQYKLTAAQIDLYTQVAGINTTEVATGAITQRQFSAAIGEVAAAVANGSTSLSSYVAAIAAFNSSGDTAASRGALIGATLKAANGPLLDYANTMVQAATANQQLVTDFGNANKSILNLKKGTIDFHNAGAAPLLNDLSNLQTAAVNSAAATYQYETSQHRAGAANDAFNVYVNNTKGALEREFAQMGLTKTQADKLATSYFGIKNSGDLKKQIGLIGDDKVLNALHSILTDLDILSGKTTRVYVDYIQRNIGKAPSAATGGGGAKAKANAKGTGSLGDGWFTVGEQGGSANSWELGYKAGSHVAIYSNAQSKAMTGWERVPGYAGGTNGPGESGGYTGVKYGSGSSGSPKSSAGSGSSSSTAASSAAKKSAADLKSALDTVRSSLTAFTDQLRPAASSLSQAASSLLAAAKAAHLTKAEAAAFSRNARQLSSKENAYNAVANRLGSAPSAPTAYDRLATAQQAFSDTKTSVSSAITGGFNIGSAGVNAQVYNDQPAAPLSASSILADLSKKAANAARFGAALKTLAAGGLPKALLLQLAQAGPDALPQALALQAASPKLIAQIGAQFNSLNSTGNTAGTLLANDLNGAGVAAAQGLIAGLKSQEAALKKQMQHYADLMVAQIKKDLGIHSPSRAFHDLGSFTGEGFRLGVESKFGAVRAAGHGLARAATPNVQAMALRGAVNSQGLLAGHAGPLVEVHPSAGLDEVAVGNVAANRLRHALATL